ncbi:hypothetical protein SAMN05444411_101939 [Lutibacter oricola]|uniref:Long-chain fatty acid transport protein n=1 Tax=Lutibacter oricola TaxID=762486 RepID=A0A1H2UCN0_9FLAO|nr:hypothetical protein [Lutibacter oricola]SDW53850.1 hypothetical protein SAMN05444411_101939 [Lutibacter oricola]
MIKKIIVIITLFLNVISFAQKSNTSAYSFYGIGETNKSITADQFSMGGIGATLSDAYHINLLNPAANTSLFFTTFSLGGETRNISADDGVSKESASTTHLSYMAVGIPLGKGASFTFGLMPNTTVGYSLISNDELNDDGDVVKGTLYEGNGGSNKVFFGFGYEVVKGLSVGVQGNYIFGDIENSILNENITNSLATKYESNSSLNSFAVNTGFLYKKKIKNDLELSVGGNFELSNEIRAKGNEYLYSISRSSGVAKDTILSEEGTGYIKNPLKTTVGVGLGKENKWYLGLDYAKQKPIELEGTFFNSYTKVKYTDYSRISLGGYYIPKMNSITSYWQRVTYRAGVKFENTGLMIDPSGSSSNFSEINDFGISFGVGLPVSKQLSNLNFGFEFGKRGKAKNGLIQENYVNFRLGLSLNDKWFKKREIF